MSVISHLECSMCGQRYSPKEMEYACPKHKNGLGVCDVVLDTKVVKELMKKETDTNTLLPDWAGMWRYRTMLPLPYEKITMENIPQLIVGNTPFFNSSEVAKDINASEVWIKDDGRNPTASLKDRASMFIAFKAKLEGREIVSTASTGNAAAALAGACASAKQPCIIFVPAAAPEAKRTQLAVYGARVVLVQGTYDDAFDLCTEACKQFGWYCRNTGFNPYTAEGKKTVAYEICEQLYRRHNPNAPQNQLFFEAPDVILVSVGDGNIVSGLHKGLRDLHALGLISKMPKIVGVQAEGSNSIAQAWKNKVDLSKHDLEPIDDKTIADSIAAGLPRDPWRAVMAASKTGGMYIEVSDSEILEAIPNMARKTGLFAEPAAATTFAGLEKLKSIKKENGESFIAKNDVVVILSTGNGLKDVATARKSVSELLGKTLIVQKGDAESVKNAFQNGLL